MKLTKEDRQKIRSWIEWQELCRNGMRQINGAYTTVLNLRVTKHKFTYDLVIGEYDIGDGCHTKDRYSEVEMKITETTIRSIINQK